MTQYFDTHAHYDSGKFNADREEVLRAVHESGVALIVDPGDCAAPSARAVAIAQEYDFVYAAVGWHPEEAAGWTDDSLEQIRALAAQPKVCAIGEIGLDYYWDKENHEKQIYWFERQLEVAREEKLPFIIHSRDAAKDTLDTMKRLHAGDIGGVVHCFSYGKEMAREYLDMGLSLGIGGVLTFKNARKLVEVVEYAPLESLLLETDSPYLAPVPNRGKRNSSLNIPCVVEKIAEIKGVSREEVEEITWKNSFRVFSKVK